MKGTTGPPSHYQRTLLNRAQLACSSSRANDVAVVNFDIIMSSTKIGTLRSRTPYRFVRVDVDAD